MTYYGLSKSKIAAFEQCPKRLWLSVHRSELANESNGTRRVFRIGHEVGAAASALYQDGMLITDVAQAYQVDRSTLHRWLTRYREARSLQGLCRSPGRGRPRKLQAMTPEHWRDIVLQPASVPGFRVNR